MDWPAVLIVFWRRLLSGWENATETRNKLMNNCSTCFKWIELNILIVKHKIIHKHWFTLDWTHYLRKGKSQKQQCALWGAHCDIT